jgi:glutathione S-transferase
MTPKLITIPISHFCEKARWALRHCGIRFVEHAHLQVFHYVAVQLAGGGISVPCLVTDQGTLADSTDILRWASKRRELYPDPEAAALEDWFDEELGPATRRTAYFHYLPHPEMTAKFNREGVPGYQLALVPFIFPFAARWIRHRTRAHDADVRAAMAATRRIFDDVGARLAGRRYLVGDVLTAADITFASLAAPVLSPPEYGVRLPQPEEVPVEMAALMRELRAHPAGQYAMRLYATERWSA